jgi:SAM-dependent methyltransferase
MFDQQYRTARDYIIPFVRRQLDLAEANVLDVGCGDGGVLRAFAEIGCSGVGVDLNRARVEYAAETLRQEGFGESISFVSSDIHADEIGREWASKYDLVILKDVIEHVPKKDQLMARIRSFLRPGGMVFFGFPPWRMPFGGHQQIASSTIGKMPYLHLIPKGIYLSVLKALGEKDVTIQELGEIQDTRMSIAGFERLMAKSGFEILEKQHFLFNPIYRFKFGLTPRPQLPVVRSLPVVRDFVTTACYYLVRPR